MDEVTYTVSYTGVWAAESSDLALLLTMNMLSKRCSAA
jgi:hypothetical protein